ncbi:MAG: TetR/AcrR family transcriptional regulator [Frankiales bacterium]|nr:MAG: TetR/AcrR family transcriptional regulator [Frankiales bacterium]
MPRREQLLEAAAQLFADHGFHAVGIDDIGAAAGISGPGVYRHFASKGALLESLCDRAMTRMLDGARSIVAGQDDPYSALESLVALHVTFGLEQRALIAVWIREVRSLSEDVRRSLRRRMREYEQLWHGVLTPLREDLERGEVFVVVGSTLAMLNGTAFTAPAVPAERHEALLRKMALAALLTRRTPVRR